MATKVHCLVGLPGSGKTFLATSMAENMIHPCIIDDIKHTHQLPKDGVFSDVIICDPNFCNEIVRRYAERTLNDRYGNVSWTFFENDREKCLTNVAYRDDGREVSKFIDLLHTIYKIPEGVVPKVIWNPTP